MPTDNNSAGLLFAGDLLLAIRNPATGIFGGYRKLFCDKFEIKTPSDMQQKISKGRETFGNAWLTHFLGKPAEFAITLDEASRDELSMLLAGEMTALTQLVGAITAIDVTVVPGQWVEIGFEDLDLTSLAVKDATNVTTYVKDVDYQINPRLGLLYVPVGGTIPAGPVKFTAGKKAHTGVKIDAGKQYGSVIRCKGDFVNLITRQDLVLDMQQATVSSQDAFDFLSGKLASVPLKGTAEIASGQTSPFQIRYFG